MINYILRTLFFLFFWLSQSFASDAFLCLSKIDGENYECLSVENDEKAMNECRSANKDLFPYYVDNYCPMNLDQREVRKSLFDISKEAVCLPLEDGLENNCMRWEFDLAQNYCMEIYGADYISFLPTSRKCSVENADKKFGYTSSDKLISGLKNKLDTLKNLLFLVDREDLAKRFKNFVSYHPITKLNFDDPVLKEIMVLMLELKDLFKEKSILNIKLVGADKNIKVFKNSIHQYQSYLIRLYKFYAFTAHANQTFINRYDFSELKDFHLQLSHLWANEVMVEASYHLKRVDSRFSEIGISHAELLLIELMALSEPDNKKEYAKLVLFKGLRNYLTNLWALDDVTEKNLLEYSKNSCTEFLNFRGSGPLDMDPYIKETKAYSFYFDYWMKNIGALFNYFQPEIDWDQQKKEALAKELLKFKNLTEFQEKLAQRKLEEHELITHYSSIIELIDQRVRAGSVQWITGFSTLLYAGDMSKTHKEKAQVYIDFMKNKYKRVFLEGVLLAFSLLDKQTIKEIKVTVDKILEHSLLSYTKEKMKGAKIEFEKIIKSVPTAKDNREKLISKSLDEINRISLLKRSLKELEKGHDLGISPSDLQGFITFFYIRMNEEIPEVKAYFKQSNELQAFFERILKETAQILQTKLKESDQQEKSLFLYEKIKGEFEAVIRSKDLSKALAIPNEAILSPILEKLLKSPYVIPVYENGVVASSMSLEELYEKIADDFNIIIPFERNKDYSSVWSGKVNSSQEKPSKFQWSLMSLQSRRLYRKSKLKDNKLQSLLSEKEIKELLLQSYDETKKEISKSKKLEKAFVEEKEIFVDLEDQVALEKMFNVFFMHDSNFNLSISEQKILLLSEISKIMKNNPFLGLKIKVFETVPEYINTHKDSAKVHKVMVEREFEYPITDYILTDRYIVEEKSARDAFEKVLNQSAESSKNIFNKLCNANIHDFSDESFITAFKSMSEVRLKMLDSSTTNYAYKDKIKQFEKDLKIEARSEMQAFTEDVLDPFLLWGGLGLIGAIGVVWSLGTFGIGAPAFVGGVMVFINSMNYGMLAVTLMATSSRINEGFVRVPEQLKFHRNIAQTQLVEASSTSYEAIEERISEKNLELGITMALLPLDIWFGVDVAKDILRSTGVTGVRSFKKLSGMELYQLKQGNKLRAKDPQSTETSKRPRFRREVLTKLNLSYFKSYLPKFQAIPNHVLSHELLKIGLSRKLYDLEVTPVQLIKQLDKRVTKLKNKLVVNKELSSKSLEVLQDSRLSFQDIIFHDKLGFSKLRFPYWLYSEFRAVKSGRYSDFKRRFGPVAKNLKTLRGKLIQEEVERVNDLISNLKELDGKDGIDFSQSLSSKDWERIFEKFDEDHLNFLGVIAKKWNSEFWFLKETFKQYDEAIGGIKPYSSEFGMSDAGDNQYITSFLDEKARFGDIFKNEIDDVKNFYESLIYFYGKSSNPEIYLLSKQIETKLKELE